MSFLASLHGRKPTALQLFASYGVGLAAAALTIAALGVTWQSILLAVLAIDWCGGVVANSAETVRAWWRERPGLSKAFVVVHLFELPLVYWLAGGGLVFYVFTLVLAMKLGVFLLGGKKNAG